MTAAVLLARAVGLTPMGRAYARAVAGDPTTEFSLRALRELDVAIAVSDQELEHIPSTGPLVIVANHPFGALDGLLLLEIVGRIRSDMKLMGNRFLDRVPDLRDRLLPVDVFGDRPAAIRRNSGVLRAALRWLAHGGCLGVFPAGEVAHHSDRGRIIDSPWQHTAAELALRAGATVVPVFIRGENSRLFRAAGKVHPLLRTALLPRELWAKRHSTVDIRIGDAVSTDALASRSDAAGRTRALRSCLDALAKAPAGSESSVSVATLPPVAPRAMAAAIEANIEMLQQDVLLETGAFQVICARADMLPAVLPEIGRLRELTFRCEGEGSGLPRDLDRFDDTYRHLFVWDRDHREIAGAYRVGATDEVTAHGGLDGLYTRALFDYDESLLARIGPALELGRAFVQPAYQRDFSPLMLLWKGIARLVACEPRYRRLFGVVSISDHYTSASRQLLLKFLQTTRFDADLGRLVKAKHPPAPLRSSFVESTTVERIEDVSALVRSLEADGKDIPVLLRQYLKLNARLLGFSVDPAFSNVLDGLVVVDLADVEPTILSRFMGRSEAREFLGRLKSD